jgi:hypothetical protein
VSSPYNASGKNGISVADAKTYIASIDTGAIADQISHYTTVATSLNQLAYAVTTINNNLQSTWSGAAAEAANTQFGSVAGQATNMASTLTDQVLPALNAAHTGAKNAQSAIKNVQDEITQVPGSETGRVAALNGNPAQSLSPVVPSLTTTPPDNFNNSMTQDQAVAFNAKQRTAAASAMNAVAVPYSSSATMLTHVAVSAGQDAASTPASPPTTSFTLTPPTGGSGSTGAANGYQSSLGSGGSSGNNGGLSGKTKVQGFVPPPPMTLPPPPPTAIVPPVSPPIVLPPTVPVASPPPMLSDPVGDPPAGTTPVTGSPTGSDPIGTDPITGLPISGTPGTGVGSGPAAPGVFGEGGLASGTGSGIVPGGTSFGAQASVEGTGTGVVGGTPVGGNAGTGQVAEQPGVGMMGGGMRGAGGGGGGGGASGGPSASYLRGRYFGDEDGAGQASAPWESPAIGGSEGVLIGAQPAEGAGVTSVYAGAQDSQGNPVGMMGGGGFGGSRGYGEEKVESGPRPGYLKEDPQWWTPEGSYVPPVVE